MSEAQDRRDNSEVRQDIGRVEGKLDMLVPLLQQVLLKQDEIQRSISTLHYDNKQTKTELEALEALVHNEILPIIKDYKEKKIIGMTLITTSGLAGGFAGGGFVKSIWLFLTGGH